jgi:hypothetical protein
MVTELGLNESSLEICYWDEDAGNWVTLVCNRDMENNIVWVNLDHLTQFTIVGSSLPAPPVDFTPLLISLSLSLQQQGAPMVYLVVIGAVVGVVLAVGLVLWFRRK